MKGDADRAEAAREGAETAQSAVNALTDEVVHYHTEVRQLALASEGSAAAAAQSSNRAAQSASESESSKNAAAQSEQRALASAESAGNSATAAAGDKSAANSFRNEAEQFAAQAKASAESIDVSALETQINEKVSQTVFDEAIAGKASNEALAEGLVDKMDIAGGEFTGAVKMHGDAIEPMEPVTLQQLDALPIGGFPLLFDWIHSNRINIPEGTAPEDGLILSRALFPDAWAEAQARHLVISDTEWLANPLKRICFSSGDGSTTFRLPDKNGKSSGSVGAPVGRGDGYLSSGVPGTIQMDAIRVHTHGVPARWNAAAGSSDTTRLEMANVASGGASNVASVSFGAEETRMLNFTGVWVIKLAGSALNQGQINALELASQITLLTARIETLESKKIIYLYPGGTEALPASISANQRIVVANPFPSRDISCIAEVKWEGNWGSSVWWYNATSQDARGTNANVFTPANGVQSIIVQSGSGTPFHRNAMYTGGPLTNTSTGDPTTIPFRVKVWRVD
ncbi:putative phage tail protein [Yersinia frederiksenii]|uniref:hypothetical protein n=1 Tax=Yersinia frederiksenii TaxID=29484 RepID=UPI0005E47A0F|nr:hypothetical protein [Yersinia frederiksenii]CNC24231.1 putative phage tail protein [Yersinia frederiksenii]